MRPARRVNRRPSTISSRLASTRLDPGMDHEWHNSGYSHGCMLELQIQAEASAPAPFPAAPMGPGEWTRDDLETLVSLLGSWVDFSQICDRLGRLPADVL